MGSNTLTAAVDDTPIPASHHNELVVAMVQEFVGRDANRQPGDLVGSLGSSVYRWLRAYINEVRIGVASSDLKIYEGAPEELWIERKSGANEVIKFRASTIDFCVAGILRMSVTNTGMVFPEKTVDYNALASRNSKSLVENIINYDVPSVGTYHVFATQVISGAIAGKSIFCCFNLSGALLTGSDLIIRIKINGAILNTFSFPSGGVRASINHKIKYIIPSNASYTVTFETINSSNLYGFVESREV